MSTQASRIRYTEGSSYRILLDQTTLADRSCMAKGKRDFAFVGFYTIFFTFTREFMMQRVIRPMAIRCGITKRGKQSRFMEQVYTAMYFAIFGPLGLYVMRPGFSVVLQHHSHVRRIPSPEA